jgi:hypothetical protein
LQKFNLGARNRCASEKGPIGSASTEDNVPCHPKKFMKKVIAGRSPLRLATFSLPTHREVVAAASRISALGAPQPQTPRLPCVPCCVSAFHAAATTRINNCLRTFAQEATNNELTFVHKYHISVLFICS